MRESPVPVPGEPSFRRFNGNSLIRPSWTEPPRRDEVLIKGRRDRRATRDATKQGTRELVFRVQELVECGLDLVTGNSEILLRSWILDDCHHRCAAQQFL